MHQATHLLILQILGVRLNGAQTRGALRCTPRTLQSLFALLLRVLLVVCLEFLGPLRLATVLKVAIILIIIQRFQFP